MLRIFVLKPINLRWVINICLIIVTSFVWVQHCVFVIAIVTGECAILILWRLRFGVCHSCYCLLIYDDSIILLCFILNCHRTFLFSQISNPFIFIIFEHNIFTADKAIHNLQFFITNNKYIKKFMLSNQATTERRSIIRGCPIVVREIVTLI